MLSKEGPLENQAESISYSESDSEAESDSAAPAPSMAKYTRALHRVCLTSKLFHYLAQPLLYRTYNANSTSLPRSLQSICLQLERGHMVKNLSVSLGRKAYVQQRDTVVTDIASDTPF